MRRFGIALIALLVGVVSTSSTLKPGSLRRTGVGLRVIREDRPSYIPFHEYDRREDRTTINVTYRGFPAGAQAAFQRAVDIWAATISSPVPIRVDAVFESLPEHTLGAAGPHSLFQNFPGAPVADTLYPDAIADRLAGRDLSPGSPDIDAFFSSTANWYFGIDGHPPPGQLDFVSVVLHELGHGVGFVGSGDLDDAGQGGWGIGKPPAPIIYDRFVTNGSGASFISFPTPSSTLTGQLQSNDLFFASPAVIAGGAPAKLYAPAVFEPLSSFNHLDETAYPGGTPNSLMTPNIAQQEAIHDPGALARRMFSDLGWGPASSAPGAAPAAVLNLVARTVGNTATLTWSASALATSYRLIAIGPGVNLDRNIGNVTTVSGSVPPGTYAISVFAMNAAGESAPATTSFVIGGAALPSPPSVVTPVVVGRTVSITWTRVADATAYRLVATLNGVPILDATVGDANSISASECPAGSYTVTVYAVNGVGQSAVGTSTAFSIS